MEADSQRRWRHTLVLHTSLVAATLAIAAGAWLLYSKTWANPRSFVAAIDNSCPLFACDFVRHYYPMGKTAYVAHAPVAGYYYSLTFAFFLHPFAQAASADAVRHWTYLQAVATLVVLAASYACFARRSRVAYVVSVVLLLTGTPLLHDVRWGQVGTLKCALVLLAWLCYRERLGGFAALLLACATVVKYEMAIFAVIFLLRRDYDLAVLYGIALGLLLVVLPAQVLGSWSAMFDFNAVSARLLQGVASWAPGNPNSQFFSAVVTRTLGTTPPRGIWFAAHAREIGYALVATNLSLAWLLSRAAAKDALTWAFCLVFLCTPFLVATAWSHYFLYMSFVQAFLLVSLLESTAAWPSRAAKFALLWLPSVVLPSFFWFMHHGDWQKYVSSGPLCYANLFLLPLAYAQAIPLLRASWSLRARTPAIATQR